MAFRPRRRGSAITLAEQIAYKKLRNPPPVLHVEMLEQGEDGSWSFVYWLLQANFRERKVFHHENERRARVVWKMLIACESDASVPRPGARMSPCVLALGMVRLTDSEFLRLQQLDRHGQREFARPVPDTVRLRSLESLTGMDVISVSDAAMLGDAVDQSRHVCGRFSSRIALDVRRLLGAWRRVRVMVIDYLRFPKDYAEMAYADAFRGMLQELKALGCITRDCEVYIGMYEGSTFHRQFPVLEQVKADDNPLYVATCQTEYDHTLDSYLQRDHPFGKFLAYKA